MAVVERKLGTGNVAVYADFVDQHGHRVREYIGEYRTAKQAKVLRDKATVRVAERRTECKTRVYKHPVHDAAPPPAPPLTLAQFIADTFLPEYAALRSSDYYSNMTIPLVRLLGAVPIAEIDAPRIADYIKARVGEVSASTVRKELGVLGTILRQGRTRRVATADQIEDLAVVQKPPRPRPTGNYLGTEDVAKLLLACEATPWLGRMVTWMMLTGMDRAEVCHLRWDAVDEGAGLLRVPRAKTGVHRTLPVSPSLAAILALCRRGKTVHGAGYVFLGPDGKPVTPNGFHLAVRRAYRRAGLTPRQPTKVFRHVFRTLARLAGIDSGIVMALMGHAGGMTEGYGAVPDATIREAMARIDTLFCQQSDNERKKGVSIPPRNLGGRPRKSLESVV